MSEENMNVRDMGPDELKRFAGLGSGQWQEVERELRRRWDDVNCTPEVGLW